jgi:drug/metabolite transporter (DMT)-like permease
MSQRLPTALSGQMIVFETIFAVTYAHILRCEIPSPMLSLGVVSLIAGVLVSLRAFQRFGHSEPV